MGEKSRVSTHLNSKGAVELLCEIEPAGSRFEELVATLGISRSTVSSRLSEGEEVGLYERREVEGSGTPHVYRLTEAGAKLRLYLDHTGMTEQYRTIKRVRESFDARAGELRRWAEENEAELEPPLEEGGFRDHLRMYGDL